MTRAPRVLLLWPGSTGSFGMPPLSSVASYLRSKVRCEVHLRDLVGERAIAKHASRPFDLDAILTDEGRGYDVIGVSVPSSFDWLLAEKIAGRARALSPDALRVAGGRHVSARPAEVLEAFDVGIVGEGEIPFTRLVESVVGGAPLRGVISGPSVDLDDLPETDWSLLQRYRPIARRMASQCLLSLSRGGRGSTEPWRAFSVDRAVHEVLSLHRWLDLGTWTLYVADALFGMQAPWRRAFLIELARHRVPVDAIWVRIRSALEEPDLRLFSQANCRLDLELGASATLTEGGHLERMKEIAIFALARNVPWSARVIVGHPGETSTSIEHAAAQLKDLFSAPKATTGVLSIEPFRLYPGSAVDLDRGDWEQRCGTTFHAPRWWQERDSDFLSEWIDPSRELDFLTRERLQHQHLTPIADAVGSRHRGPRGPLLAAMPDRFHTLDRYFAWSQFTGRAEVARQERRDHPDLVRLSREARQRGLKNVQSVAHLVSGSPLLRAIEDTPRERFVPLDALRESTEDVPVAFGRGERSTVSAMHAYALTFQLADLRPGQRVLDLGAGSGYGTAILAKLLGREGFVRSVEIDPELVRLAEAELDALALGTTLEVLAGDALDPRHWTADLDRVVVGFALPSVPSALLHQLKPGAIVVAPIVISPVEQRLARIVTSPRDFSIEWHGQVRYVPAQREAPTEGSR